MIKAALISDIHSNHFALQECLAFSEKQRVDRYLFLGDYVSDCPYPERTMEVLYDWQKRHQCFFLRGNREDYMIGHARGESPEWIYNSTSGNLLYTFEHLTGEDIRFFERMPIYTRIEWEGMLPFEAAHGSPDNDRKLLQLGADDTKELLKNLSTTLFCNAHTHIQGKYEYAGRTIVNAGACGNPMHFAKRVPFAILTGDENNFHVQFYQIPYDVEPLMREYEESGLNRLAPFWVRTCKQTILTGGDASSECLQVAMRLCTEAEGSCNWPLIDEKYWAQAVEIMQIPEF